MDGRPTGTDCDEAGDYVVPNVLSPRDLVFRPDNMDETVPHTFIHQRKPLNLIIKTRVINCIGAHKWREFLVKLLLDCSRYSIIKEKTEYQEILNTTTNLCYKLHVTRINKLSKV